MAKQVLDKKVKDSPIKIKEAEITQSIRGYLSIKGIWHYKHYNGGKCQGKKGISDIIGCYQGRFLAIEVKTENGKVSEPQQKFIDEVNQVGGIAFVARSVDDVIRGLK